MPPSKTDPHNDPRMSADENFSNALGEKDVEKPKDLNAETQEVMEDHLELMLDIVMQIREDEEFAKSIYANCPRLQNLLDLHPDLRPVFEDPNLVRINFEEVYRKAGGVLPEDRPSCAKRAVVCIVNHPLFKVFRFLLLLKKFYNCIVGGGVTMIKTCLCAMCAEEAADVVGDNVLSGDHDGGGDHDADGEGGNSENQTNKESLNRAADHMEEPETQSKMQRLLQGDPDKIAEGIENDPELRALRDSSPLCAELMGDPETMKILVDPDNLRALAECPDVIEADFANPDWTPPDVESPAFDDAAAGGGDMGEMGEYGLEEEEGGFLEDFERGEVEEADDFDADNDGDDRNASKSKSKSAQNDKKRDDEEQKGGSRAGGIIASVGAGLIDYIAAETVGMTAAELTGGGDEFGTEEMERQAEDAADETNAVVQAAEVAASDDVAGNMEETMDKLEDQHDKHVLISARSGAGMAGTASGMKAFPSGMRGVSVDDIDSDDEDEDDFSDEPKKRGKFKTLGGAIGKGLTAFSSAAKEHVAVSLLGDDFGEQLVEKMEESGDEDEEAEEPKPVKKSIRKQKK